MHSQAGSSGVFEPRVRHTSAFPDGGSCGGSCLRQARRELAQGKSKIGPGSGTRRVFTVVKSKLPEQMEGMLAE